MENIMTNTIQSKTPVPQTEWYYAGKKKDGTPKIRRQTNETAEYVAEMLDTYGIPFLFQGTAKMFRVYHPENKKQYQYFYTTGQWGMYYYGKRPEKHYHSNGVYEFITKYLLKKP
jgi:hypothetical protein